MSALLALDVALLLPPDARDTAIGISGTLPADQSHGLQLDADHLPHITLTQQFIRADEQDAVFERIDAALRNQPPIRVHVTGGGKGSSSVWMAVERTKELADLHEVLMEALRGFERPGGTAAAFHGGDARVGDVAWVTGYRLKSSLTAYNPHVTLGHAAQAPTVAPFTFAASTVAACHLGRFCSCRVVLRAWDLVARSG
jgi:2'-5' RNA ligase